MIGPFKLSHLRTDAKATLPPTTYLTYSLYCFILKFTCLRQSHTGYIYLDVQENLSTFNVSLVILTVKILLNNLS